MNALTLGGDLVKLVSAAAIVIGIALIPVILQAQTVRDVITFTGANASEEPQNVTPAQGRAGAFI